MTTTTVSPKSNGPTQFNRRSRKLVYDPPITSVSDNYGESHWTVAAPTVRTVDETTVDVLADVRFETTPNDAYWME